MNYNYTQDDGVVLTLSASNSCGYAECVDIQIPPEMERLVLGNAKIREISYHLVDVMKQFPNIRELLILANVRNIAISNYMFPNVRSVDSHNAYYYSGQCLIKSEYAQRVTLLNAFCLQEEEVLDLTRYDLNISRYAFEGCRSDNIILPKNGFSSYGFTGEDAFFGHKILLEPLKDGVAVLNDYIITYDQDSEEVILPPEATCDATQIHDPRHTDRLVINNHYQSTMVGKFTKVKDVVYNDPRMQIDGLWQKELGAENFHVHPDSPYYTEIDGVLYTRDKTTLVVFPSARTGDFKVPEGVIYIQNNAFQQSALSHISLPDSLLSIGKGAFEDSKLTGITLGNGVREIGENAFYNCREMTEIDISSSVSVIGQYAFMGCKSLKKVTLHDGLLSIDRNAFASCDSLKSIAIPKSVLSLNKEALYGIKEITFEGSLLPAGFYGAVCETDRIIPSDEYKRITVRSSKGDTLVLPIEPSNDGRYCMRSSKFVDQLFEPEFIDNLPDTVDTESKRQEIIIEMWNKFSSDEKRQEFGSKMKRNAKKICMRLINQKREALLIKFFDTGLVTNNTLKVILQELPEDMVQAKAAILNRKNAKKSTFRL